MPERLLDILTPAIRWMPAIIESKTQVIQTIYSFNLKDF